MEETRRTNIKGRVTLGILMILMVMFNMYSTIGYYTLFEAPFSGWTFAYQIISMIFIAVLAYLVYRGIHWAKIVLVVILAISVITSLLSGVFMAVVASKIYGGFSVFYALFAITVIVLLFAHKGIAQYFKSIRSRQVSAA